MAHKKGQGSSRNGRDSNPQRLGLKAAAGQFVTAGSIIVRQRGTKFIDGLNCKVATDDSVFALADGYVRFRSIQRGKTKKKIRSVVDVLPTRPEAN